MALLGRPGLSACIVAACRPGQLRCMQLRPLAWPNLQSSWPPPTLVRHLSG